MIDRSAKVYRTINHAMNDVCLDYGFNPFLQSKQRPTKTKLAEMGYHVDAKQWTEQKRKRDEREQRRKCRECGEPSEYQVMCTTHGIGNCGKCLPEPTGLCREHTEWTFECDNGHKWSCTSQQDRDNGHKCPKCGEYWQ